jgi:F0F1-type ATP synthase membrane subunit c/vacuolar-type H+-ATPase subunit K
MAGSAPHARLRALAEFVSGGGAMNARKILEWGGLAAGVILIAFGIAAIYMGVDGRNTVQDSLKQEQIYFGDATDPAVAKHAEQWAGDQVLTGDQARAFALVMREHTLESTGDLTYAQMGRYQSAAKPDDPKGTSDEAAAAKDDSGQPIANGARNIWVTETALTTALNTSYMAEQLSIFGIVVGVALLLTGIGLMILAVAVLGGRYRQEAAKQAGVSTKVATGH